MSRHIVRQKHCWNMLFFFCLFYLSIKKATSFRVNEINRTYLSIRLDFVDTQGNILEANITTDKLIKLWWCLQRTVILPRVGFTLKLSVGRQFFSQINRSSFTPTNKNQFWVKDEKLTGYNLRSCIWFRGFTSLTQHKRFLNTDVFLFSLFSHWQKEIQFF